MCPSYTYIYIGLVLFCVLLRFCFFFVVVHKTFEKPTCDCDGSIYSNSRFTVNFFFYFFNIGLLTFFFFFILARRKKNTHTNFLFRPLWKGFIHSFQTNPFQINVSFLYSPFPMPAHFTFLSIALNSCPLLKEL